MSQHSEKITFVFTFDEMPLDILGPIIFRYENLIVLNYFLCLPH